MSPSSWLCLLTSYRTRTSMPVPLPQNVGASVRVHLPLLTNSLATLIPRSSFPHPRWHSLGLSQTPTLVFRWLGRPYPAPTISFLGGVWITSALSNAAGGRFSTLTLLFIGWRSFFGSSDMHCLSLFRRHILLWLWFHSTSPSE